MRREPSYAGLSTREAAAKFVKDDPALASTVMEQTDRLRAFHGTLGSKNKEKIAQGIDNLNTVRKDVISGKADDSEYQGQAVQFENRVQALRNAERLRGSFLSYVKDPNMALDADPRTDAAKRLELRRIKQLASRKDIREIEGGDTDVLTKLADRSRHLGERIRMLQNGVVNMAAFAASSLIQAAVTGIMQGIMEQETALRAVRAAVNMQGGTAPSNAVLREQGAQISQALGINRGEALTLLSQTTGGGDPTDPAQKGSTQQTVAQLTALSGILNATGETTAELSAFYGGLKKVGVEDNVSVIQTVVGSGLSLKQAETNRMLVEDGLKNYGSDKDKALVIMGAQQVSSLKDWKLSDSTLVRERQMQRLEEYGSQMPAGRSQTSLPLDALQKISQQAQATLESLIKAFGPLIQLLGAAVVGTLKLVQGVADFVNMTGPLGRLVLALGVLAGTIKMLTATAEMAAVRNMFTGILNMGGDFIKGVKNLPVVARGALDFIGKSALGQQALHYGGALGGVIKNTAVGQVTGHLGGKALGEAQMWLSAGKQVGGNFIKNNFGLAMDAVGRGAGWKTVVSDAWLGSKILGLNGAVGGVGWAGVGL